MLQMHACMPSFIYRTKLTLRYARILLRVMKSKNAMPTTKNTDIMPSTLLHI